MQKSLYIFYEVIEMVRSYKNLWKILIDKDLTKSDLSKAANVSMNVITKMGKNELVSMDSLERICAYLHCNIGDIVELIDDKNDKEESENE